MLFTLALIVWSAIVTYVIVWKKRTKLALAGVSVDDEAQQSLRDDVMATSDVSSDLESFARSQNMIISRDALDAVIESAGNDQKKSEAVLKSLAKKYVVGDEYTTIDLNKVQLAIG
jgi:Spy/CpxP family protein refolding chaperone